MSFLHTSLLGKPCHMTSPNLKGKGCSLIMCIRGKDTKILQTRSHVYEVPFLFLKLGRSAEKTLPVSCLSKFPSARILRAWLEKKAGCRMQVSTFLRYINKIQMCICQSPLIQNDTPALTHRWHSPVQTPFSDYISCILLMYGREWMQGSRTVTVVDQSFFCRHSSFTPILRIMPIPVFSKNLNKLGWFLLSSMLLGT